MKIEEKQYIFKLFSENFIEASTAERKLMKGILNDVLIEPVEEKRFFLIKSQPSFEGGKIKMYRSYDGWSFYVKYAVRYKVSPTSELYSLLNAQVDCWIEEI